MTTPTFMIAGAPRSGTTSLYHYLDQHPAVYMSPIKEPYFFAPGAAEYSDTARRVFNDDAAALKAYLDGPMTEKRSRGFVLEWEQYQKLFKNVREEAAIGEATVACLACESSPAAIRTRLPGAKIVLLLRDPVDRLFSHYSAARMAGERAGFVEWTRAQQSAETGARRDFGVVWCGYYGRHLRRYHDHFPRDRVRVYLYDELTTDAGGLLRDLFGFLGVDPAVPIDTRERHNATRAVRFPGARRLVPAGTRRLMRGLLPGPAAKVLTTKPPEVSYSNEERARLLELYGADIAELAALLGRDLSHWLVVRGSSEEG